MLTGKWVANRLADNDEEHSSIHVTVEQQQEARKEQRDRSTNATTTELIQQPSTLHELHVVLNKLKKSPGPDLIMNEMLTYLGHAASYWVFNHSWENDVLPQIWREATMIHVYRKRKDRKKATSYHPISLISCVVLERITNQRLQWYLETENTLAPKQSGFR